MIVNEINQWIKRTYHPMSPSHKASLRGFIRTTRCQFSLTQHERKLVDFLEKRLEIECQK